MPVERRTCRTVEIVRVSATEPESIVIDWPGAMLLTLPTLMFVSPTFAAADSVVAPVGADCVGAAARTSPRARRVLEPERVVVPGRDEDAAGPRVQRARGA